MDRRVDRVLIEVFVVEKPEDLVLPDRPAERETRLQAAEERIGVARITVEHRIGRDVVVAVEGEPGAVIIVAARARDDVDRTDRRDARRKIEIERRNLELLNRFDREVLSRAPSNVINDAAAVNRQTGQTRRRAADRDGDQAVGVAGIVGSDAHAGFESGQRQVVAPVERQAVDLLPGHDAVNLEIAGVDHRGRIAGNDHGLVLPANVHADLGVGGVANLNRHTGDICLEALHYGLDFVFAGKQVADHEDAVRLGRGAAFGPGLFLFDCYHGPGNYGLRLVRNRAAQGPRRNLGRGDHAQREKYK